MRVLAVVSGAPQPRSSPPPPARTRWFLDQLLDLGAVDLVLVHDTRSAATERDERRVATIPARGVARCLEITADPPRRSGLLRDVHIHRSAESRARSTEPAAQEMAGFVAGAPQHHDLAWSSDIAALARVTWVQRAVPAAVDVDRTEDLAGARALRAARAWAANAYLVTVPDPETRDRLAVPGTLVVDATDGAAFRAAVTRVVDGARAYRPARTP